ncbi:hypothetical protein BZG36_03366 [Bifiguratus adelaidae]|uniref:Pre-mRNA-splicing factor cwc15 n=1 Tax=Bifiguratus adelaidae TaxID=1938954 RepID=A0A261XXK7_9FUNG|nr:hypothetical protein BZG36_03366 [Bifiguratus adelaidae]
MTTAARPTFDPARGKGQQAPTRSYSARDIASHTKLKFRHEKPETDRERMRAELRKAELEHYEQKRRETGQLGGGQVDDDMAADAEVDEDTKTRLIEAAAQVAKLDKDDTDKEDEDEEDEDDDDDDDTEQLMRELEKIKRERAEEKERQEREKRELEEAQRSEEIATGNPLLNIGDEKRDFSVKRRWDDDVIFRNQARGLDDKPKKRFINDALRSDFHRKFLSKYVR